MIRHFCVGNLDLGFSRTRQRNYIKKEILAGFLSKNATFKSWRSN